MEQGSCMGGIFIYCPHEVIVEKIFSCFYFYFLFGPGLLYPLRVLAKVQIFFGSLVGPLTKSLTLEGHPK